MNSKVKCLDQKVQFGFDKCNQDEEFLKLQGEP